MPIFEAILEDSDSPLWGAFFKVPKEIGDPFINGENRRVICTINNQHTFHCALMPEGEYWFILVNKQIRNKLGIHLGEPLTIEIKKDTSEYGMEMPEEFRVLLDQDEEGADWFEKLTKGKQRNLIYIVAKVKNPDSRINKGLAILHHLKENKGEINFKRLIQLLKEYNKRGSRYT